MAFSSWICSKNTKNMFVKIVHPGGHGELHDRPILAAEIIYRNPRCVVAHLHVFQQPWAIVAPETELTLGQKFYVVPVSTIRKLQRLSYKYSPTPTSKSQQSEELQDPDNDDFSTNCWFFMNKNNKTPYSCTNHSLDDEDSGANSSDSSAEKGVPKDMEEEDGSCFDDESCFACMITGVKSSNDHQKAADGDDSTEKTRSPGNFVSADDDDQTRARTRRRERACKRVTEKTCNI